MIFIFLTCNLLSLSRLDIKLSIAYWLKYYNIPHTYGLCIHSTYRILHGLVIYHHQSQLYFSLLYSFSPLFIHKFN